MKNQAAVELGRRGKGIKKTLSDEQRVRLREHMTQVWRARAARQAAEKAARPCADCGAAAGAEHFPACAKAGGEA